MLAFKPMRLPDRSRSSAFAAAALLLVVACGEQCFDPKHPPASIQASGSQEGCPCDQTTPVCVEGAVERFALVCTGGRWTATATDTCHP